MIQWLVYKHTSLRSGKSYIGVTKKSMEQRWKEHCNLAKRLSKFHFHRAISLYGEINWEHAILAESIDTLEEACSLERYYIKKYDTFENGYNSTFGGEGTVGSSPFINMSEEEYKEQCTIRSMNSRKRYSTKEYTFYNPILDIKETTTCVDLANKYNLHQGYVRYVAQEKVPYTKDWFLWKGETHDYNKQPIYTFIHELYGKECLTLNDMATKYNLSKGNLHSVIAGKRSHTKGWKCSSMKVTDDKSIGV